MAVIGMNDEDVFSPVVHKLTFGEAIERDLLTDFLLKTTMWKGFRSFVKLYAKA